MDGGGLDLGYRDIELHGTLEFFFGYMNMTMDGHLVLWVYKK